MLPGQQNLPTILNSQAYQNGGVVFITWDEGEGGDGPIGMIVLSPDAKGGGYSNTIHYTHSSTLHTIEEIFGVTPLLGDAANATDLRDLFTTFPWRSMYGLASISANLSHAPYLLPYTGLAGRSVQGRGDPCDYPSP